MLNPGGKDGREEGGTAGVPNSVAASVLFSVSPPPSPMSQHGVCARGLS